MDIRKLQRAIVDGLEDVKGQDILVLNTEHLSALFERVVIASGTSNRQTKALASSVREAVKAAGLPVLSSEGGENGEWIIVDCGAAVAHIMQPAIRDYYRLEEIWGGKPVKMTLRSAAKGLVKASEADADDDEDDEPVKKRPARKTTAAAKSVPKPAARAPGKAAQAKPTVVPLTPAKKAANRAVAAKKALAMAAPAKKARPVVQTGRAGQLAAAAKTAAKAAGQKAASKTPAAKVAPAKTLVVKPVDRRTPAVKAVAAKKAARRPAAKTAAAKTAPRKPRG